MSHLLRFFSRGSFRSMLPTFAVASVVSGCLVLAACLVLGACGKPEPPAPTQPTAVIVLDIDTLRADALGAYGADRETSPRLDALAASGVRFEWAFAQAPNTPPSQASILSGLYPTSHGRIRDDQILPDQVETLAEHFAAAGWRTAAFVDGGLMAKEFGLAQGFEIYDDEAGGLESIWPKARDWLVERVAEAAEGEAEPFFLLIHTYDVHSPYDSSPQEYQDLFTGGLEPPSQDFRDNLTWRIEQRRMAQYSEAPYRLTAEEVAWARALYDGGVRYVDDRVGEILDELERLGLDERALIAVVSDHGDEFEEHDSVYHERLYSTVTRVPLIFKFPGDDGPRGVLDQVVETIDLMPTVLEASGLEVPEAIHGESLLPLIEGGAPVRSLAVSESPFHGERVALTTSDQRLFLTRRDGSVELYDFRVDPLEQTDVSSERPDDVEALRGAVESWLRLVSAYDLEGETATIDPETREQLEALGYL